MLKQIRDFPRTPMELNVEFPGIFNEFYFQEIDFVPKISNYLFLFECKGTVAPLSEEGKYIEWVNNFFYNLDLLEQKGFLIKYNIDKGNLPEKFFQGIDKFVLTIIQTEGLLFNNAAMNIEGYEKFLEHLRIALDENKFNDFMESNTKLL